MGQAITGIAGLERPRGFGQRGGLGRQRPLGVADVDAIALSLARLAANQQLELNLAASAILVAALSNSLFKTALAFGAKGLGAYVALGLLPGGVLALLVLQLYPR